MNQNTETELKARVHDWLQGFPQGTPVVVVPVFNAYDDVLECIESLATGTPPGTPILIVDDASTDHRIPDALEPLSHNQGFAYVRKPSNSGFVGTVNLAFEWCAPRDLVIVNSDVVVPPEWLQRLRAAAYFRSTIATATPLTNHGTILSVPYRNQPTPDLVGNMTTAQIDAQIRAASLLLRPIIPSAIGHCIYFKRVALDAVGYFDEAFSPGYGEEVDFCQRAVAAGFLHVAADDLFVFHKGSRSFDLNGPENRRRIQGAHEEIINARYPWYRPWVEQIEHDARGPLALALENARAALLGYRIAIDATQVGGATTGTQVLILELTHALATTPGRSAHLTMIVGDQTPQEALCGVDQLIEETVSVSDVQNLKQPIFDLVHRPPQVRSLEDLDLLQRVAHRFIVSQLDCISYANPSYAESPEGWQHYRALNQLTFATADGIVFNSNDVALDSAYQGLHIPPERACVTYNGVDHHLHSAEPTPPDGSERLGERPFMLMLGTNFRHKNRVYALRILRELVTKYQWPGQLVLAGPKVSSGGSVDEEARELQRNPDLQSRVHDLGAVDEGQKKWLLAHAALLLYPSICEGFGLVPFEAAAAGTPALTTRATSLGEVLGDHVTYLDTLNPETGAEIVWTLLSDAERAKGQVEAINARAAEFTWRRVADSTWEFYQRILKMPPRPRPWMGLDEQNIVRPIIKNQTRPSDERNPPQPISERPTQAWRRRMVKAIRIVRTEGIRSLFQEIWQFIRWLLA